jgi:UDP-N-acetylglucosamine--N-acetylmuramyl-(pentapeptide) pyrophosphoryl-undecaprenol N-acetylglucosamine transferase
VQKILITTGGTGGHVIPAQIIKDHLEDEFEVFFSTDLRGLKYLSKNNNKTILIDTPKFNLNFHLPFKILKLIFLVFKSLILLKKKKIKKIISIGGYMSLPIIISAIILRLPIFLIEPNLVLGRGNKFFLKFANKILCYSNKLTNFPEKYKKKIQIIKPLVSKNFYALYKKDDFNDKFCFLIFGGSQGAKIFDNIFVEIISKISKNFSIKVIQQTNKENIKNLKNFYNSFGIENIIFDFDQDLANLIHISDLCITRAGATSLAEISFLEIPFIAIPLPTSKDNHQMKNAEYYEKKGCCWILDQNKLNKDELTSFFMNLLKDKV